MHTAQLFTSLFSFTLVCLTTFAQLETPYAQPQEQQQPHAEVTAPNRPLTEAEEAPKAEPKRCVITLKRIDVLKRKLNYQLWDSIEQPAPELLARVKVNQVVIFEHLLAQETYALDLNMSTAPFACAELLQGVHITVFDQDKDQAKEPIGELTHTLKSPLTAPLKLNLSGGAVRQFILVLTPLDER